jgi:hypothetical protein
MPLQLCLVTHWEQKKQGFAASANRLCWTRQRTMPNGYEVCSGTTPSPKLNQTESAHSSPYPNPYPNISIPRIGISYSSTSVPYERYPSHIRTFADHRRRRPSARSLLPLSNLAAAAARQSGEGIARQSCGCPVRLSRQSGGRHKIVRRPTQESPARSPVPQDSLARASQDSSSAV